jgi:hypothetical protein
MMYMGKLKMTMNNNNNKLINKKNRKIVNKCTLIFSIKKLKIIILILNGISLKAKINNKSSLILYTKKIKILKRIKIHKHLILIKFNHLEMRKKMNKKLKKY